MKTMKMTMTDEIKPIFTYACKKRLRKSAKFFGWIEKNCLEDLVKMIEELELYELEYLDKDCYKFAELNVWHWESWSVRVPRPVFL